MFFIKRALWTLLALLILVIAAGAVYVNRTFPALDGELKATGLKAPVSVTRDAADVTHIKAQSPMDAWFAIGYLHAQERGWQLEFNRRVMHGELSEAFGAATLETDKLLRTLGIMQAAERQWQALPAEGKDAMTRVTLRPAVTFSGPQPSAEEHAKLHEKAHARCFIANSINSEVVLEPRIA